MYSLNLIFEKYIKYYLIKGKFNRCSKDIDLGVFFFIFLFNFLWKMKIVIDLFEKYFQ